METKKLTIFLRDKDGNESVGTTKNGKEYIKVHIAGNFSGTGRFYPDTGVLSCSIAPRRTQAEIIAEQVEAQVQAIINKKRY